MCPSFRPKPNLKAQNAPTWTTFKAPLGADYCLPGDAVILAFWKKKGNLKGLCSEGQSHPKRLQTLKDYTRPQSRSKRLSKTNFKKIRKNIKPYIPCSHAVLPKPKPWTTHIWRQWLLLTPGEPWSLCCPGAEAEHSTDQLRRQPSQDGNTTTSCFQELWWDPAPGELCLPPRPPNTPVTFCLSNMDFCSWHAIRITQVEVSCPVKHFTHLIRR